MTTAPTSESVAPSAAITAAITPILASRSASAHELQPARAERARLARAAPAAAPGSPPAVSATMYGQREDRLRDVDGVERELDVQRAERALRENSRNSTSADDHRRQRRGSRWRGSCSARRPRKRPSPSASPIGSPITSATAVEISATRSSPR